METTIAIFIVVVVWCFALYQWGKQAGRNEIEDVLRHGKITIVTNKLTNKQDE